MEDTLKIKTFLEMYKEGLLIIDWRCVRAMISLGIGAFIFLEFRHFSEVSYSD